jgi:Grx4 family monothiol glutaredoxin
MGIFTADNNQTVDQLLKENDSLKVLYFYVEDSAECNQMTDVINELDKDSENKLITFIKINAAKGEEISKKFEVENAPTILFYSNGNIIDRIVGANVPLFSKKLEEHRDKIDENSLNTRLEKLIKKAHVMLFMKGNPSVPRCGFSKQVIALLDGHNAKYETFDILEDYSVREGLKKYSNWPTYPQLYIKGELIGGLDILKELSSSGELDDLLKVD